MKIDTRPGETGGPAWTDRMVTLPVYAIAVSIFVFVWFSGFVEVSYENRVMSLLLNTLLVTGVSAWAATLALRGYLACGLPEMLYAGCGLVAMGSSFFISSLSIGTVQGPNVAVTVHNLGVFCASFFHLAASLRVGRPRASTPDPTAFKAASAYLAVLALTGLFWAAAQYDLTPVFYIPGKGATPTRQMVLTLSVAIMAVAAAFLIRHASQRGSVSLRCYGLGLVLIAVGIVDVSIAVPGSIVSWTGRLAQGLGNLYLLSAFMVAIRTAVKKGLDVRDAAADYYLESEDHYRALVHALRAGVISLDSKGKVVLWNTQAEVLSGYSYAEAAGRPLTDLMALDGGSREALRTALAERSGQYLEMTLRRKDGAEFPADVLVFAAGGAFTKWTNLIIRDTSGSKQAEETLRRYELLSANSRDIILYIERNNGRILEANAAAVAAYGYSREELLHLTIHDLRMPGTLAQTADQMAEAQHQGALFETRHRRKDGSTFSVEVSSRGATIGGTQTLVSVVRDITERKRAEDALRKSERLYRAIGESIDYGVWVCAADGRNIYASESFLKMVGITQEQCSNFGWGDVLHPEDAERTIAAWKECVRTGGNWDIEHRFRGTDGQWHAVLARGVPVKDEKGEILCWAGINLDISRLKQTELALRNTHNRVITILESISDGFFSLDRQFRVTFVNETGARAIGQTRESMLGRVLWEIFPEAVGSDFERAYRKAMTERVTATTESVYPPLNAWFEAHAYPSEDGISVFFRDVTDRRRVEQTLRESQADLNWAQAVGRIGSWRLNVQRNELLWSDENYRIFGVPKGQPLSYETFLEIVHPEDRAVVDRKWTAALQGEPYDIEHRIVVGNTVKWVRERAELVVDAGGQLLGGFGITQDISDRKQAEKELRESEARFRLLADTAAQLLGTDNPQAHVRDLAGRVMAQLDCHCFFNFLVTDEEMGRLRLNAWAGIPEEEARRIEWLDFGVAVCGCVARDGRRIVAEHIPITPDVRTELVKSYGIKAYACHPLTGVDGRMLGTLSFGTRSRETFSPDDLALMKAVTDQVAVAMVRMQNEQALRNSEEALRKANDDLEETVRKRTRDLEETVAALKNEIGVRKKIQTQLRQLSRVFMDAADPIIIEDLSGKVVELNREAEAEYGWSREELIGKPVDTLFLPERCHLAAHLRERCCAGEEIRNWEGVRIARSGRIIPTLLTAFPLTDESGDVAFVATICKDISARKEMEERLNEAQRHLQALSRKSMDALESDRRSVARELHDSIGGSLAAIKFGLEEAAGLAVRDPVGGSALLGTLVSYLADTIKETKRISANLRPLSIDDLGLLATIEWYTRQFSQRYENISLVRQIEMQEHEIPEDYKIVFYRVMQEALTNAAKHSKADTINIRLKKVADGLELEVEDNGCGFNLHKALERSDGLSGYGLRGMQERAEICGGSISIHSRPGAGTHIRATLPISEIRIERGGKRGSESCSPLTSG